SRLAAVLSAGGVGRGDRVSYLGLNSPTFLATYLASAWVGAIFLPVNFRLSAEEVHKILADAGVHTRVAEAGHARVAEAATGRLDVRRLLVDDDPNDPAEGAPDSRWESLSRLVAAASERPEPLPCGQDDPGLLVYTSGTTGRAKGVPLTHGNLWWNCVALDTAAGRRTDDVNLVVAPLFHTAPFASFALRTLTRGGTNIIRRAFEAGQALADLSSYRVNTFFAVPAMYRAIARAPGFASADLSALQVAVTAGAPAPPQVIAEYADRGVLLQQAYGLTEVLFATCVPAFKTREKLGSVGVPLPFVEIRLTKPGTDEPITEPGVPGEVCIRSPSATKGYFQNPEATALAFTAERWFHSGDIGQLDPDGFLFIVDRAKDMIIVAGDNVYSGEVERVLAGFPGVGEVAVVGVPDGTWGEVVVAAVTVEE
ncbi:MAG TPA: AMP-binding protein, partial [Polyangiaceae bacterium]|nr:AMP-binding protein [Polyangiaceae bacterium]